MSTVLVVDGTDVCRAPITEYTLRSGFADAAWLTDVTVESRGLEVKSDATMCDVAADRIGFTSASIAFYGSHRAHPLTADEVREADLVLTAERDQRSAVVRLAPGSQARVFTWKEARVLATIVTERTLAGAVAAPEDLADLARVLHASRGSIPVIEPPVRTAAFHWRKPPATDPLSISEGHADTRAAHRHAVDESRQTAMALTGLLVDLAKAERHERRTDPARIDWWRRGA
jgi:protein-tyrosine phosphatase